MAATMRKSLSWVAMAMRRWPILPAAPVMAMSIIRSLHAEWSAVRTHGSAEIESFLRREGCCGGQLCFDFFALDSEGFDDRVEIIFDLDRRVGELAVWLRSRGKVLD